MILSGVVLLNICVMSGVLLDVVLMSVVKCCYCEGCYIECHIFSVFILSLNMLKSVRSVSLCSVSWRRCSTLLAVTRLNVVAPRKRELDVTLTLLSTPLGVKLWMVMRRTTDKHNSFQWRTSDKMEFALFLLQKFEYLLSGALCNKGDL